MVEDKKGDFQTVQIKRSRGDATPTSTNTGIKHMKVYTEEK
jgi:hypothetical protein